MTILKKIPKKLILIFLTLALFIFFSMESYAQNVFSAIESNVFRLHIIANSNTEKDQDLKYKVRDSLVNYMNTLISNDNSKEEIIHIAKSNLNKFKLLARETVLKNGFNYDVDVEIGNFYFPTKKYGDIRFPSGNYDALNIRIGKAVGQNWWCVMFPPLCFVDVTSATLPKESKETLKENLRDEEYQLISESDEDNELKFRIVEIFNSLANKKNY